ncbi:hypothetical protein RhiirA1_465324 [Rhizophagus irregularis]|uniref:Uncharacterized protein n=1 Tax=Rhizophagus irregularis TaxID=588596 RepID=A0A2N0RG92_9GLOM|nr:hypothetical protein RhiirA1_465324 [Rhizophagus irregularis]CAB4478188.1 unnamed protein product [Rhizophagus irregularis]
MPIFLWCIIINKPTTDEHQPSKKIAATGTERGPSGLYINTKVRKFITCNECSKVRYLFSGRQLIEQDGLEIQHAIENWPYTCGSTIFLQDHNLFDKVFVQEKICCKTPMEFTYYSCRKVHSDWCYHCGSTDDLQDKLDSLMEKYKSIISLYAGCQDKGLDFFCQMPIQTKK